MLKKIFNTIHKINWSDFSVRKHFCSLCGGKWQVILSKDEMGVRCLHCRGSAVSQSLGEIFNQQTAVSKPLSVYELSSRGAWFRALKRSNHQLVYSEFFDGVALGDSLNGVSCQDIQQLTYEDEQFDICTSLEVFEHVEDDAKGFQETWRVLKPGGMMLFTVPLTGKSETIERTAIIDGERVDLLPREYHSDHLKGENQVFCYRNYGNDITERMARAGFVDCQIIEPADDFCFGFGRPVVVGFKPQ